ncbi:MAG: hypothetical protein OEY94_01900 [Alphaproteobacteria bacterium]|nr:hypothetical protein [Alphaproteobacteria bacterium]
MKKTPSNILILSLFIFILAGCTTNNLPYMKEETARRLASAAWMVERDVSSGALPLRVYERMHERRKPANIYISGEGGALGVSFNKAPENPVALHLATKDKADNLAYIARPCHYIGAENCAQKYWGGAEYSEDVINAYSLVLDDMAKRYDIKGFNLIGYSGGATIAALLADKRSDILSIRSVAGILDTDTYSAIHEKTAFEGPVNPSLIAVQIKDIPQFHFIGGKDEEVPPAVLHGYLQATPPSNCIHNLMVQEATHDKGWVDKWPELLDLPLTCYMMTEKMTLPAGTEELKTFEPDFGKALKKNAKRKISPEKPVKP